MEKLIELAIKYDREKEGTSFDWSITNGDFENHIYQKYLISKEYGFIERLSENNKINFHKSVFTSDWSCDRDDIFYQMLYNNNLDIINEQYGVQEPDCIIMYLSVEENPVETLISMLR